MPVGDAHRFLTGMSPERMSHRIMVFSGDTQDYFYHDAYHGCVKLRRTLELWARENGVGLTVLLTHEGILDFSGNPNPEAARAAFEALVPHRPLRAGLRPRPPRDRAGDATPTATPGAPTSPDGTDVTRQRLANVVAETTAAAGGQSAALRNTLVQITYALTQTHVPILVLVEDLYLLVRNLDDPQRELMITTAQKQWHGDIGHSALLFFLRSVPDNNLLENVIYPPSQFKQVRYVTLGGPSTLEVSATVQRFCRRQGIEIIGLEGVAQQLASRNYLKTALNDLRRIYSGRPERPPLSLQAVLELPDEKPALVATVRQEAARYPGMDVLNRIFDTLQQRATERRRQLRDGATRLDSESNHLIFEGNPGVGKTTAARLVARFCAAVGLVRRDIPVERTVAELVGEWQGETTRRVRQAIEDARGGVLFIDEAHQLGRPSGDPYHARLMEAINVLVPYALNYRNELIIILAGYPREMTLFYQMDSGIEGRFPRHNRYVFPDYTPEQLKTIFDQRARERDLILTPEADQAVALFLRHRSGRAAYRNGRAVENALSEIRDRRQARTAVAGSATIEIGPPRVTLADVPPLFEVREDLYRDALASLGGFIGLEGIREHIERMVRTMLWKQQRVAQGIGGNLNFHPGNMRFVGPPGTGKTSVAQMMGKLLFAAGAIERPDCIVVARKDLVGGYQGQSALLTAQKIRDARDAVIFVDEAYALAQADNDSFGREALDTLVEAITDPNNAGTVFIFGGYPDAMARLMGVNEGLLSRFPNEIRFEPLTAAQCSALALLKLRHQGLTWEEGVEAAFATLASEQIARLGTNYGSGRWVDLTVEAAITNLAERCYREGIRDATDSGLVRITDVRPAGDRTADVTGVAPQANRSLAGGLVGNDTVASDPAFRPDRAARRLPPPLPAPTTLTERQQLVARAKLSSALIQVETINPSTGQSAGGTGTGFFVTADGILVTSAHVVENATAALVYCDPSPQFQGQFTARPARVIALDRDTDLALLAVAPPGGGILDDMDQWPAPLPLGETFGLLETTLLDVIGNAHVTPGDPCRVVGAHISRNNPGDPRDIETDGALEPGFSGGPALGPVLSAEGSVIGAAVLGVVKGSYGVSRIHLVRAEQVVILLRSLGYTYDPTANSEPVMDTLPAILPDADSPGRPLDGMFGWAA